MQLYTKDNWIMHCIFTVNPFLNICMTLIGNHTGSIPGFSQSVGWDFKPLPVFWDALKPESLPVEPSGVPGHRTTKSINPPGQYWYSQRTRPQKQHRTTKSINLPGQYWYSQGTRPQTNTFGCCYGKFDLQQPNRPHYHDWVKERLQKWQCTCWSKEVRKFQQHLLKAHQILLNWIFNIQQTNL